MPTQGDYVVVTTDLNRRGVFAGILFSYDEATEIILLQEARNCLFWSKETFGFLGLAKIGPQTGSRVSPSVPELMLNGVTAVLVATRTARAQWELGLWSE